MTAATRTRTRLTPDTRRAEILEVARRAFAGNDDASVSQAEIAEPAGVIAGLVNHYFGVKRELYLAVLEDAAAVGGRSLSYPEIAEVITAHPPSRGMGAALGRSR